MSSRVYKWDNAKFVAMLAVVMGHIIACYKYKPQWTVFNSLNFFIYCFQIPVFLFISGLMQKTFGREDKLNVGRLAMFFRFFLLLNLFNWLGHIMVGTSNNLRLLTTEGVAWFMLAMIIFTLIVYITRGTSVLYLFIFSIVFSCFKGYDSTLFSPMFLAQLFGQLPFFLLGYMLDSKQMCSVLEKFWIKAISVIYLVVLAGFLYLNPEFAVDYRPLMTFAKAYSNMGNGLEWYHQGLAYIVIFCTMFAVIAIMPNRKLPLISVWGSRTMNVYLFHRIIIFALVCGGVNDWLLVTLGKRVFMIVWLLIAVAITCILSTKPVDTLTKIVLGINFPWKEKVKK